MIPQMGIKFQFSLAIVHAAVVHLQEGIRRSTQSAAAAGAFAAVEGGRGNLPNKCPRITYK
jgi:hypothetical protein